MSHIVLPATPPGDVPVGPEPIKFVFCPQPSIKPWMKGFNAKTLFQLDDATYRTVMADMKQLCITSGLDMTKPLKLQARSRLHTLYTKALSLYSTLAKIHPPTWPVDAFLCIILRSSTQQAIVAVRTAEEIEQARRELQATVMISNLSRLVPPPTFPVIFNLTGLPQLAWLLFEVLLDVPLVFWPWFSLTALRQLPLIHLPQPISVFPPRSSLLVPTTLNLPQKMTVTATLSTIPPCPYLTQWGWSLRLTVGVMTKAAASVGGTSLSSVQALPLLCELL